MTNPAQPAKVGSMRRIDCNDLVYMADIKSRLFGIMMSIQNDDLADKPELLEQLSKLAELVIEYEGAFTYPFMQMRRAEKEGKSDVAE
ncbi:hypothetical protein SAMN04487895_12755 [Paenibacillus sophorae]|uniref:Coat F domain-containing protein n=1 Tax=Paenibacillus sophorae TaxID=1333845 RepID=A0A1H8VTM0_9BACL|nr:hypothetical protein [Paenibacillus sophorae]QWU15707.1 hypothetical protein KP014_28490 [Paenibacillus sophorae]SEP18769.1 hypothetical protein SAMN04487895_12755 [Paenibacillus sophorae]